MKKRVKGNHIVELTQNGIPSTWFVVTKEIEMQVCFSLAILNLGAISLPQGMFLNWRSPPIAAWGNEAR